MIIDRSTVLVLPLTILAFIVSLQLATLGYCYWQEKMELMGYVRDRSLVDASRLARLAEEDLAASQSKIERELRLYTTELNSDAIALITADGRILLAQNSNWKGRHFSEVLPTIDEQRLLKVTQGFQADEQFDAEQSRFNALIPFALPSDTGNRLKHDYAAIYIAMDFAETLAHYRQRNLIAHLPLLVFTMILAAALAFWLNARIIAPINEIAEASRKLGYNLDIQVPNDGIHEIDHLALAFNATVRQLSDQQKHLQLAAMVFDTANEAILITDANALIEAVNPAFTRITGYSKADAIGKNVNILQSGKHDQAFYKDMWHQLLSVGTWSGEIEDLRKNGEVYSEWLNISRVRNEAGETTHYVAIFADLSEIRRAQALAERLSGFDSLTGLHNRDSFLKQLEKRLHEAWSNKRLTNLILIDVDQFKAVNEAFGLNIGDDLLRLIAERFKSILNDDELLARLGSDEFVVLTPLLEPNREVAARYTLYLAERLQESLNEALMLNNQQFSLAVSIGIALLPDNKKQTPSEVMRQADLALRQAKLLGRGRITFFEDNMSKQVRERYELERALQIAIPDNQLRIFLQPQVEANGKPVGAEALVRWEHPTRGLVSPAVFIPLAESSELIIHIDNWMLYQVCHLLAQLDKEGNSLSISVNISPRHFQQTDFVEQIKYMIRKTGADPTHLILEVTEGLVIGDYNDVIAKMDALSEIGIRFSMDDFGTGYSSLAYLKRLPIHEIKIDKSFIQDIPGDKNDVVLVETILAVARHLHLKVVAEGVETQEQVDFLNAQGDVIHQGYFFGKPMPVDAWQDARSKLAAV